MESVKLATKLTPAIKAWIKEEFKSDYYESENEITLFHFPNYKNREGFIQNWHINHITISDYTEVSEAEFLAEFGKKPIIQTRISGEWVDVLYQEHFRVKPQPDYSQEIEALHQKATENGMKVKIEFEKSGKNLDEIINHCVTQSWGGFKASWKWEESGPSQNQNSEKEINLIHVNNG